MFGFLLVVGLIGFVAHKTRPSEQSFRDFLSPSTSTSTAGSGDGSGLKGWFMRKLSNQSTRAATRDFKYQDLHLLAIVSNLRTRQVFLGVFGAWFLLMHNGQLVLFGGLVEVEADQVESGSSGTSDRELAIQAKARKDYSLAYRHYLKAATASSTSGSGSSDKYRMLEAAGIYEEASKVIKISTGGADSMEKARSAQLSAAQIYERWDGVRAGRAYEKLGELYRGSEDTRALTECLDAHMHARSCFSRESDAREWKSLERVAELQAQLSRYADALRSFDMLLKASIGDRLLAFRSRAFMLSAGLCMVALKDWNALAVFLDETVAGGIPSLMHEREYQWLKQLHSAAARDNDREQWDQCVTAFIQLSPMDAKWKQKALETARESLDTADSLT